MVSLAFLVAGAAGFVGLAVFKYSQGEMIALKVETGILTASLVEERLRQDFSPSALTDLSARITGAGFTHAVLTDRNGLPLASLGPKPAQGRPNQSDLLLAVYSREVQTHLSGFDLFSIRQAPDLILTVPMTGNSRVVGALGLYSPLNDLRDKWMKTGRIIIFLLLLDTLVTVGFGGFLLSRRLVTPLGHLAGRVSALAEGQFQPEPADETKENEIGRLETSFEKMAARIIETRRQLEENLETLKTTQEGLVKSEKMASVGRLGAGLAHELGNPLGSLLGFVHLLKKNNLTPEERADFLARMESEIIRMDGIIRSLLDYARPHAPQTGPVSLAEITRGALALAEVQKWFAGLEIEENLDPDLPDVRGEANRITQVLLNLLENAGQAMNGQGRLILETGKKDDFVYVSVDDAGPGIAPEDLGQIFDPFFTRKEPGQGTGLGLSISQSIVESFGGRLEVVNKTEERGCVFTVFLPKA